VDHAGDLHRKPGEQPANKGSGDHRAHSPTPAEQSSKKRGDNESAHGDKRRAIDDLHEENNRHGERPQDDWRGNVAPRPLANREHHIHVPKLAMSPKYGADAHGTLAP